MKITSKVLQTNGRKTTLIKKSTQWQNDEKKFIFLFILLWLSWLTYQLSRYDLRSDELNAQQKTLKKVIHKPIFCKR